MKKFAILHTLIASIIIILFLASCGIDSDPVSPGGGDDDESYTISLSIEPSTAYRTAVTANSWIQPMTIEFHSAFQAAHQDDDDHSVADRVDLFQDVR